MIKGIIKTKLKIINKVDGSVMHGLKYTEYGFKQFGEIYVSTVKKNIFKGWNLHKKMTLNIFVPHGKIQFFFIDNRKNSITFKKKQTITLSVKNYFRLTVPPNIWFKFRGLSSKTNMLVNVSNMIYDDKEIIKSKSVKNL